MALKNYFTEGGSILVTDLALLPTCTLKKMQSDDGHWNYFEGKAWVGKKYKYSSTSRRVEAIYNEISKKRFSCEIVMVYDDSDDGFHMMPVECLNLEYGYKDN